MQAIIIDDIPSAIQLLKEDVEKYCPEIEIVGTAGTIVEAVKTINNLKPELLFLDIELPKGTGFDILDMVAHRSFQVIFTTASNAYAIKAFRYAAMDYLLKPIDSEQLKEAVQRAKNKHIAAQVQLSLASDAYSNQGMTDHIMLHTSEEIKKVRISDIIRCQSNDNYTMFYFTDGKKLFISKTLKYFDNILTEHGFLRVHQSHLINPKHLETFVRKDGGYLRMCDKSQVPVSVRKKPMVLSFLNR